jgi:NADH-quinone oxidoreductase subunit C
VDVLRFLKDERGFTYLSDLGTIDRFTEEERFEVFYNVVNIEGRKRLRVKVRVEDGRRTDRHRRLPLRQLARARGVGHDGDPVRGAPGPPADVHAGGLRYHPQRKEFPTIGIPGSLPLPPQSTDGEITLDPFARAHGQKPRD